MPWHLYILQCADRSLYTGVALDVRRRLREHRAGKGSKYVRSRLPAKLVYTEIYRSKRYVMKREAQIKRWTRKKKLKLAHHCKVIKNTAGLLKGKDDSIQFVRKLREEWD